MKLTCKDCGIKLFPYEQEEFGEWCIDCYRDVKEDDKYGQE